MAGRSPEETDRRIGEAISARDLGGALDLFEPGAVFVDPGSGAEIRGTDAIRDVLEAVFRARPRLTVGVPKVVVSGDIALVLSRWHREDTREDGTVSAVGGVAADVMRRQTDGSWRWVIDNPAGVALLDGDGASVDAQGG